MVQNIEKPGFLARFWQVLLETSEVAVAVHYREPWVRARPADAEEARPSSPEAVSPEPARAGWQDCRL